MSANRTAGEDSRGTIGIRLLEAPVARRDDPRALTYIVDHVSPGTVIKRRLEISNTTGELQRLALYPAAADIVHSTFGMARGRAQNELTSWMSLDRPSVTVPAGGSETAQVAIKVPPTASRGERYGVVWAQAAAKPDDTHGVRIISRVGIRVYLDIGPGGEPPSDFQIEKLTPMRDPDGRPQLLATVRNTGERTLDMSGTLLLSDGPGGLRAGPFSADLGVTLAPGSAAPVTVTLDQQMPDGPWKAELTLMSGMVKRTVTATLTFPRAGMGQSVLPDSNLMALLSIGGLVVLLVPALGLAIVRRRRRARLVER